MQTKYTTLQKVKDRLTSLSLSAPSDPEIEDIISIISKNVDNYIGYKLATDFATTKDLIIDGSGTGYLMLNQPVYAYLRAEHLDMSDNATEIINIAKYPLNSSFATYLAMKAGKFISGVANYRLKDAKLGLFSIDWANSTNHTLELTITNACTSLCVAMINAGNNILSTSSNNTEKSGKITGETIGSYSISYATNEENFKNKISEVATVSDVLNPYKSINII